MRSTVAPFNVRVLTLVSDDALRAIRGALHARDRTTPHPGVASLLAAVSEARTDAVVVDPALLDETDWIRLKQLLADPNVPVLLYSALDPATVRRVVAASAIGVHEVLLRGIDDDAVAIRRRLESLHRPPPPARVLSRIADRVARLPASLQGATVPLFCEGPIPRRADAIARAASVPRRSADRWMQRAGLAGMASLLNVARLSRVWVPLIEGGLSPAEVARRHGYVRSRALAVHARRVLGVSPTRLGAMLSSDEFVDRLAGYAVRDPAG
jgi:AraC-like DNA-binding protein